MLASLELNELMKRVFPDILQYTTYVRFNKEFSMVGLGRDQKNRTRAGCLGHAAQIYHFQRKGGGWCVSGAWQQYWSVGHEA